MRKLRFFFFCALFLFCFSCDRELESSNRFQLLSSQELRGTTELFLYRDTQTNNLIYIATAGNDGIALQVIRIDSSTSLIGK